MNKRIRELMIQSDYAAPEIALRAQKLAELIVRECVRHFNEDYQRDFDTLWREDLSKSIKQHFGVKE